MAIGIGKLGAGYMQSMLSISRKPTFMPANLKKEAPNLFLQATRERFIYGPFKLQPKNVCSSINNKK